MQDKQANQETSLKTGEQSGILEHDKDLTGKILSERFELTAPLGVGAFGTVWKAKNIHSGSQHAVKLLKSELLNDERSHQRFLAEARAASKLNHGNIILVQAFGIDAETPFIVMQYIEGQTLAEVAKTLSPLEKVEVFLQIADGMRYAHEKGLVHRDLKPSNVMVKKDGNRIQAWILDFGLSKLITDGTNQGLTMTGDLVGSPLYMSPEQCLGKKVDARSDIYSFGCLMHEAVLGKAPFVGATPLETMRMHVEQQPAPFSASTETLEIPQGLEEIVCKCLWKAPQQRYQSFAEVFAALQALDMSKLERVSSKEGMRLGAGVALLFVLLVAACVIGYLSIQKHKFQSPTSQDVAVSEPLIPKRKLSASSACSEANRIKAKHGHAAGRKFLEEWYATRASTERDFSELQEVRSQLVGFRMSTDDSKGACEILETALKEQEKKFGTSNENYFYYGITLAKAYLSGKQIEKANAMLSSLRESFKHAGGKVYKQTHLALMVLEHDILDSAKDEVGRERVLREAVAFEKKLVSGRDLEAQGANVMENISSVNRALAKLLQSKSDWAGAEPYLWRMNEVEQAGRDHCFHGEPERAASFSVLLAENLIHQRKLDQAEKVLKLGLAQVEPFLSNNTFPGVNKIEWRVRVAVIVRKQYIMLATTSALRGDKVKTLEYIQKALSLYRQDLSPNCEMEVAVLAHDLVRDYSDYEAAHKCVDFLSSHPAMIVDRAGVAKFLNLASELAQHKGKMSEAQYFKRNAQSIAKLK